MPLTGNSRHFIENTAEAASATRNSGMPTHQTERDAAAHALGGRAVAGTWPATFRALRPPDPDREPRSP